MRHVFVLFFYFFLCALLSSALFVRGASYYFSFAVNYKMNLEELLKLMMEKDASDIYITAGLPPTFRVEGKTKPISGEQVMSKEDTKELAFSLMSEKQKDTFLKRRR